MDIILDTRDESKPILLGTSFHLHSNSSMTFTCTNHVYSFSIQRSPKVIGKTLVLFSCATYMDMYASKLWTTFHSNSRGKLIHLQTYKMYICNRMRPLSFIFSPRRNHFRINAVVRQRPLSITYLETKTDTNSRPDISVTFRCSQLRNASQLLQTKICLYHTSLTEQGLSIPSIFVVHWYIERFYQSKVPWRYHTTRYEYWYPTSRNATILPKKYFLGLKLCNQIWSSIWSTVQQDLW